MSPSLLPLAVARNLCRPAPMVTIHHPYGYTLQPDTRDLEALIADGLDILEFETEIASLFLR